MYGLAYGSESAGFTGFTGFTGNRNGFSSHSVRLPTVYFLRALCGPTRRFGLEFLLWLEKRLHNQTQLVRLAMFVPKASFHFSRYVRRPQIYS